jgi:hypothetical protein
VAEGVGVGGLSVRVGVALADAPARYRKTAPVPAAGAPTAVKPPLGATAMAKA